MSMIEAAIEAKSRTGPAMAESLLKNGYMPIPIPAGQKGPRIRGWQQRDFSPDDFPDGCNIGLRCDYEGLGLLDVDVLDPEAVQEIVQEWRKRFEDRGQFMRRTGRAPKVGIPFRTAPGHAKRIVDLPALGADNKIEVLGRGQQFVAFGIHPDTGRPYQWGRMDPLDNFLGICKELPEVSHDELAEFCAWAAEAYGEQGDAGAGQFEPACVAPQSLSAQALGNISEPAGPRIDTGNGSEFWRNVNTAALDRLDTWVPVLLPAAQRQESTGAWRVSSRALGRDLQEDLAIHPNGIRDFGAEKPLTPLDLVQEYGDADNPKAAALWLCEHLGTDPAGLGWRDSSLAADSGRAPDAIRATQGGGGDQKPEQPGKPRRKFSLIRSDFIEAKEPEFLIDGLIEAHTLVNLFGDPGSGKSFVAVDMAYCVGTGTPFHGRKTRQGPVIYIAGEGRNGFGRRRDAWVHHHGVSADGAPVLVSEGAAQFLDEQSAAEVAEAIDEWAQKVGAPPQLIIVDTLNRNMGAGDESNTKDMSAFIAAVDALKDRYGAAVLIVHHTGHGNKERARGSAALLGAVDCEYRTTRSGEAHLTLTNTKMKEAPIHPPLGFKMVEVVLGRKSDGDPLTSLALSESEARAAGAPRRTLSPSAKAALDSFLEAKKRAGREVDPGAAVSLEEWRPIFFERSTADGADAKKKAFQRARKALVEDWAILAVQGDQYRLAKLPEGVEF